MAQFSKSNFRGLLIPDPRITDSAIDVGASSYNNAGPQPGIPQPQASTDLNLEASGTQTTATQLQIATQRGGHPGRGGATFRWKLAGDSGTLWRGTWPASAMSSWRTAKAVDPSTASGARAAVSPHAVLMDNNSIGCVYHRTNRSGGVSFEEVRFFSVSEAGVISAGVTVFQSPLTSGLAAGLHPCIVKLPSGRLIVFHYLDNPDAETMQVQSWISDDNGATWALASANCLSDAIDISGSAGSGTPGYDLGTAPSAKMRVAYSGGQVVMFICFIANDTSGSYRDGFFQFASSDEGNSFEQVEVWGRTMSGTQAEVVGSVNGFEVYYVGGTASNDAVIRKSLGSAFIPLSTATQRLGPGVLQAGNWAPGAIASQLNADAEIAVTIGDDGILYILARGRHVSPDPLASSNLSDIRICMDRSGGASKNTYYELMGQGSSGASSAAGNAGTVFYGQGGADYPKTFGLTAAFGRLSLFHNHVASTATRDDALGLMTLGGYSTVSLGAYQDSGNMARNVCWDITWLPIEKPDNFIGWTKLSTASFTASVNGGFLALTTGEGSPSTGKVIYAKTPTGTIAEGIVGHFACQHVSQVGVTTNIIHCKYQLADGSNKYQLMCYVRSGMVQIVDNNGGGVLGSLSIDTSTKGVECLVFMRSGKATVFARVLDYDPDRQWLAVCSNATVSTSGTGSMSVVFGHAASNRASSNWFWCNWVSDEYAGATPYSAGFINPDQLIGKNFNNIGTTYVSDGVAIRGIAGPTTPSDSWDIETRFDHSISNIHPSSEPSPSKGWRSTDTSEQVVVWSFTGVNRYNSLGLYLDGINFRTATLSGWNAVTSAWVALASVDAATGQTTLAYNVLGDTVTVNTGATTAPGRYYEIGELVGGVIHMTYEFLGLPHHAWRTITGNSAGVWTDTAGHQLPGIEYSGSVVTIAGTLNIWSPRILVAVHNVANVYTKFKLTIDATQNPPEGYYKIGQMIMGPLHLLSQDYSYGRTIETEPNTTLSTYSDGSRSSINNGANRRAVTFGWGEGVDVSGLQGTVGTPDFLEGSSTSGAPVIGYRGDIPSVVKQINATTKGSHTPLVYCPNIAAGSTSNDVKHVQGLSTIYGRMIGGVTLDSVVGEELTGGDQGELFRVAEIRIEEEL